MKKILITGGAGYIGSHTVIELVHAGYEPIIVDDFSNSEKRTIEGIKKIIKKEIKVHVGDCGDFDFMNSIFVKEKNIEGAIHFAAYKAVGESVDQPLKYYENNIGSLMVLLKIMSKHNVENMVFSSSCTVYGEPDELPVTEFTSRQSANSPYGNTKQICEDIIRDVVLSPNSQGKAIALRYFNPIGAHASGDIGELPLGIPNNLVPYVVQTAVGLRELLTIHGDDYKTPDGTCIRDYIHVVDLAKAHVQAINHLVKINGGRYYDIFNIGTGIGNSVLEVVQELESVSGVKINYIVGKRREGDVEKIYGNVDKAKRILKWKAELTLSDALRDAWKWQKSLSK